VAGPLGDRGAAGGAGGDELLTLARDGVLDEASIEFAPVRESMVASRRGEQTLVRHRRAHLRGVGLVPHGAYGRSALVTSVRDDEAATRREEWLARLRARTA
jgi:phage head maturation protease